MSGIIILKKRIQNIYNKYSIYVEKALQFILVLMTLNLINKNIGMMSPLMKNTIVILVSVICTFLPLPCVVCVAAVWVVAHVFSLSMSVAAVTALIFVLIFLLYGIIAPKHSVLILVTALAFLLNIPYVIPIACGLLFSASAAIPAAIGVLVYYMIIFIRDSSAAISGVEGMTGQVALFVKGLFQNKSMWVVMMAFVLCILVVVLIRQLSVDYAWKIAVVAGVLVTILVVAMGDVAFDIKTNYSALIIGNIIALLAGAILEFLFFSVDYSRTEHIQYEDDEYVYYVKAVPKVTIAEPEKTVKQINKRVDAKDQPERRRNEAPRNKSRKPKAQQSIGQSTEEMLLTKSIQEEFDINEIVENELKNEK